MSIADVLGMILWCKYFIEAQGHIIDSNLLYQDNKSTIISMIKYHQKVIQEFPEHLSKTTACPATDNLFKFREEEDRELLSEEMAKQFNRTTGQLLFLCKQARPDPV